MTQIDEQLQSTAGTIGRQGLSQIRTGDSQKLPSTYYVEAQYLDGTSGKMVSDETAGEYGTPVLGTLSLEEAKNQEVFTAASSLPGQEWRVIALPIASEGEFTGVVAIGLPLKNVMQTVEQTRLMVAFTNISVIVLGAAAATYLVRRSFRPLRQIERVAGRIASGGPVGARAQHRAVHHRGGFPPEGAQHHASAQRAGIRRPVGRSGAP